MTAWEKAAKWYESTFSDRNFGEAIAANIVRRDGHVYACGDVFAMGQEVHWDNKQKRITNGEPNAWFVELAAFGESRGNPIYRLMSAAPYPLEWCLWQRRNDGRIRARRWQDLITKLQGE